MEHGGLVLLIELVNVPFGIPMHPTFSNDFGFLFTHLRYYSDGGVVDVVKFDIVGAVHLDTENTREMSRHDRLERKRCDYII
jgi:hypothetical protein